MKQIGSAFFLFGIGSVLLYFVGYEFALLSWIDNWGETSAWLIRGALIILGGILWFLPTLMGDDHEQDDVPSEAPSE